MLNSKAVDALPLIYETATNPGRWRRTLDAVAGAVEARAIALLIRQPGSRSRDKQMLSSAYLDFMRTPSGRYYALWLSRLQNPDWDFLARQPSWRLTPDTEIGPSTDALDDRADYALLRRKVGVSRRLGVKFNDDKMWFDAASLAFKSDCSGATQAAKLQMEQLLPHLTKAVEMGRSFSILKSRYSAVLTALDHVQVGLAVALPSGEIVVSNSEMKRILDLSDGVRITSTGHLELSDADQSCELKAAVEAASRTAEGVATSAEVFVAVERRSGASPYLVDVAPLSDGGAELESGLCGALVTVIDPDKVPNVDMKRFVALYGFTQAEAEVCQLILEGHTTEQIAEMRSTSPATARNQIKALLTKTNTARRAELVRLVMRVLPPVS